MPILKVFANHKFVTQGIWIEKGSKKVMLSGKKGTEYLKNFNLEVDFCVYTAKKNINAIYNDFRFNKEAAKEGANFTFTWNESQSVFDVVLIGKFERELNETEIKMLFESGQTLKDIGLSIKGLMGGEIWNKGFISRIDSKPERFNAGDDNIFPVIDFEYIS